MKLQKEHHVNMKIDIYKPRREAETDPFLIALRRKQPFQHLYFAREDFRSVRQETSVV